MFLGTRWILLARYVAVFVQDLFMLWLQGKGNPSTLWGCILRYLNIKEGKEAKPNERPRNDQPNEHKVNESPAELKEGWKCRIHCAAKRLLKIKTYKTAYILLYTTFRATSSRWFRDNCLGCPHIVRVTSSEVLGTMSKNNLIKSFCLRERGRLGNEGWPILLKIHTQSP